MTYEYYVSLEVAKLLKEAGFDWETEFGQHIWDRDKRLETNRNFNAEKYLVSLPTLDVAQRWLRDIKNISVDINSDKHGNYSYVIHYINMTDYTLPSVLAISAYIFNTYEKAQKDAIKKVLEIILEKGE